MSGGGVVGLQVLCGAAIGFTLVTLLSLLRLRRRVAPPAPVTWPAIAVLRPCEGPDPRLLDNLLSSVTAPYPGPRRAIALVPSQDDPAWAVAEEARRRSGGALEVVVTGIGQAGNRKVAQLLVGLSRCGEEIVVQADSDVLLGEESLTGVVAALLADARCGAAFAAPVEIGAVTWADRASAALVGASQQSFLALYAVADALGGVPSLAGALCGYRREALGAIGGLAALQGVLGEDYEVARRLLGAGYRVAITPDPARCTDGGRGLGEVVRRVGRWLLVVRAQRPGLIWGYPFFLAATPLHLLLAAALRDPLYATMALGLWLLRGGLALGLRLVQRAGAGGVRGLISGLGEAILAEGLMWLGLCQALRSRRIHWRGHAYRVERGGRLVSVGRPG